MNNEINKQTAEQHTEIRPQISVAEFIAQFDMIESGMLYQLGHYPTDEEAQQLAKLATEVSVLELSDNQVVISKGKGKTQAAFTRGELLELKPKKKAHTHPTQPVNPNKLRKLADEVGIPFDQIDQALVAKMGMIIPSPDDLTVGSVGATTYEIWSEYGKTVYQTYSLENEEMIGLALQMTANLYRGKDFISILTNSELSPEEKVAKMNGLLKPLGLAFEFQAWS